MGSRVRHTERKVEGAQSLHGIFGPLRRHLVEDLGAARPVEAEDEPGDGLDGQGGPYRRHHAKVRGPGNGKHYQGCKDTTNDIHFGSTALSARSKLEMIKNDFY